MRSAAVYFRDGGAGAVGIHSEAISAAVGYMRILQVKAAYGAPMISADCKVRLILIERYRLRSNPGLAILLP